MTRNVYVGADPARPVLGARTRADFERLNTQLWRTVRRTNFRARARLLAREIKQTRPDLIGMQEVAIWRRGERGVTDGPATPARFVVYDFRRILQHELRRAGLRYAVAAKVRNADVEAPTTLGFDIRLTDRDLVLVNRESPLRVRGRSARRFEAEISLNVTGIPVRIVRGWSAVDASLSGRRFRFVTTHLDPTIDAVRISQTRELLERGGPIRGKGPVILAGDLNSRPIAMQDGEPTAYGLLARAGFVDTWVQRNRARPGYSCCMRQEDIMDPPPAPFTRRIDHVLTRPRFRVLRTRIVGRDPENRTASGLWPSDHGGHVTTLRFR